MDWERPPKRNPRLGKVEDFNEIFRQIRNRFPSFFSSNSPVWVIGAAALIAFVILNSYYMVEPQETAVVLRFGRFIHTAESGLHFKFPFGVDTVRKVVTGRVLQREYGYRTGQPGSRSRFMEKGHEEEAMMLSGDLNVLNFQWTVQYKIQDPVDYLFQLQDVEGTLDDISESVIRRIVGNRYSDEVLTVGRASIAEQAGLEIQKIMDSYRAGIQILTVKLQNVNPPDPVKTAFNEVNEARQEKERMINEAQQAYNQQIPKAAGEARQTVIQAEGYALERVNRSLGETNRFLEILAEYRKAPEVTRKRMYLESMAEFLGRMDHLYILDENERGLLPLFNLNPPASRDAEGSRAAGSASLTGKGAKGEEGR